MSLISLIDNPKELLELINECLKQGNREKTIWRSFYTTHFSK